MHEYSSTHLLLQTVEDILFEVCQFPEMNSNFVIDIEHILENMNQWFQCSILGEHSRMRSIVGSVSENCKWWPQNQSDSMPVVDDQLSRLTTVKMRLFEQFASAIRKQLKFFKIAKVRLGGVLCLDIHSGQIVVTCCQCLLGLPSSNNAAKVRHSDDQ